MITYKILLEKSIIIVVKTLHTRVYIGFNRWYKVFFEFQKLNYVLKTIFDRVSNNKILISFRGRQEKIFRNRTPFLKIKPLKDLLIGIIFTKARTARK